MVPGGLQGLDRYAYVSNNPINRIDPTGHADCSTISYEEAKKACEAAQKSSQPPSTFDDFKKMTWAERKTWLQGFAKEHDLGDWFNDMIGAIDYLAGNADFSQRGDLADLMDAGILQAVNDGWLIHQRKDPVGTGGQAWAKFFADYDGYNNGTVTLETLRADRLRGEQGGVDNAWNNIAAVKTAKITTSGESFDHFNVFKQVADKYRWLGSEGFASGRWDARDTGKVVAQNSWMIEALSAFMFSDNNITP